MPHFHVTRDDRAGHGTVEYDTEAEAWRRIAEFVKFAERDDPHRVDKRTDGGVWVDGERFDVSACTDSDR